MTRRTGWSTPETWACGSSGTCAPRGANEWRGWAYVPLYRKTLKGRISLESRRHIRVGGCIGPVCKSQDWARVW
ncbi:DUF2147 domain-containing protein [Jhaorihella thermophila]